MSRAALCAAFVTTALVLLPHASAAQPIASAAAPSESRETVTLLYEDDPPANCPTEAEFEAEVGKLTNKAHFTKLRRARRVRIELISSGHEILGRLVSGDARNQAAREVRGKDCREVASAMAIAVALTIDPEALSSNVTEPVASPDEPPPVAEPVEPPATKPAAERQAVRRPTATRVEPLKLHWGVGAGLTLENAWAPQMRAGAHAFGIVGVGERFRATLGLTRFVTREVDEVTFGAWFAESSVVVNLAVLGVLRPFARAGYEFGAIEAAGTGLATTVQAQREWHAVNAGVGISIETDSFFLRLGGCLLVPISRQRYLISDQLGRVGTLYEVPPFALKQEASLGVFL